MSIISIALLTISTPASKPSKKKFVFVVITFNVDVFINIFPFTTAVSEKSLNNFPIHIQYTQFSQHCSGTLSKHIMHTKTQEST